MGLVGLTLIFFGVSASNVVWLLVDDLRPQLGAYEQTAPLTPRLDALARESVVFEHAYCQLTVCSPSRNSFLSGRRPDSIRVYNFRDHIRSTTPDTVSLPEFFKYHGYTCAGSGKTFQPNKPPNYDPRSWSGLYLPLMKNYTRCHSRHPKSRKWLDVCPEDGDDRNFMDRKIADYVVDTIRREDKFFVVAGFYRPHLRWHVPERFYRAVQGNGVRERHVPVDMPHIAWTNEGCHTMTTRQHGTRTLALRDPLPEDLTIELRRGYFACVAWIDHLSGRVLDATPKDAIVVVSSDHGFHLGEQASWTKHTLFELSARVPFMIRAPGLRPRKHHHAVELVDIYRTVTALAGLPPPPAHVQGSNVFAVNRSFAVTQYPRCPVSPKAHLWETNCKDRPASAIPIMGYTVRVVGGVRFTEWYAWANTTVDVAQPPIATELYAYDDTRINDLDNLELVNLAPGLPCDALLDFRAALTLFVLVCQHLASESDDKRACDARVDAFLARAVNAAQSLLGASRRPRPIPCSSLVYKGLHTGRFDADDERSRYRASLPLLSPETW